MEALINRQIPNARPHLDESDYDAVRECLSAGAIAQGAQLARFEQELSSLVGAAAAAGVSSGFAAIHLALRALGVTSEDEVVIPAAGTCSAIRDAVYASGARPVFADTNAIDLNLSVPDVKSRIGTQTRAIISPHHTGIVSAVEELVNLGIPVIEDCAQCFGIESAGRKVGSLSHMSVFSFYATKLMTTIEGGAVVSGSEAIVERVRDLRYYGTKCDLSPRLSYRMPDLHAAIGRTQLARLGAFVRRRAEIARRYRDAVGKAGLPAENVLMAGKEGVDFRFGLRIPVKQQQRARDQLSELGIPHRSEAYVVAPDACGYPNALRISNELITFPTYPALSDEDTALIAEALARLVSRFDENELQLE